LPDSQTVNVRRAATCRPNPLRDRPRVRIGIGRRVKTMPVTGIGRGKKEPSATAKAVDRRSLLIRPRVE
jgi:hypothetical protein